MEKNQYENRRIENLERLLQFPETITSDELEAWKKDEVFLALYRTAMDARRIGLEKEPLPDTKKAFQAFRRKEMQQTTLPVRKPTWRGWRNKYGWITASVAACALLCLTFFMSEEVMNKESKSENIQVYTAQSYPDEVILSAGESTIPLTVDATDSLVASLSLKLSTDKELHYDEAIHKEKEPPLLHTLTVPQGKDFHLVLADGTRVWVNAESSLVYPSAFTGNTRTVKLQGEAYFEVAKDKEHPFVVEAGALKTTVLGTSFNVRCYEQEESHVTLVEGSVNVKHRQKDVILHPGEDAMLTLHGELTTASVDVQSFISWKSGEFYFDGITFKQMMVDLGRWYGMDVVFSHAHNLNDSLHLHADRSWDIHEVVRQINLISDTKVHIEDHVLVVE